MVIRRIADRGFRLTTWIHLHNYLDQVRKAGDIPEPRRMLLALLPWAWRSKPGLSLLRSRWFAVA